MTAGPRRARLRSGGAQAIAHTLRAATEVEGLREGVAATLDDVRSRGDDALVDAARRFDAAGFAHDRLRVPPAPSNGPPSASTTTCGRRSSPPPHR